MKALIVGAVNERSGVEMKDEENGPGSPRHGGGCRGWDFIPGSRADRRTDLCLSYPAPRARAAGPARAPERCQIPSPPAGGGTFSTYRHHACNPSARLTALSRPEQQGQKGCSTPGKTCTLEMAGSTSTAQRGV